MKCKECDYEMYRYNPSDPRCEQCKQDKNTLNVSFVDKNNHFYGKSK